MSTAFAQTAISDSSPRRARRWLMLLIVLLAGLLGAFVVAGLWPVPLDVPPGGATNGAPGSGGLRRAFPAMALRPDNPVTPEKVELGRLLYFDPVLSGDNTQSCATCHHPDLGLSDGRHRSMGAGGSGVGPARAGGAVIKRAAPTIWNAAYNHRQFWDGRAADLEEQARGPITSANEMNQQPDELVKELKAIPEYAQLFDKAFGSKDGAGVSFDNVTYALASFERTLISDNSPFDRYAAGDTDALTPEQKHGLTLFRSLKTRCFECHGFPTFANPDFKVIGVPRLPPNVEGLPPSTEDPDLGRAEVTKAPNHQHAFKVPTLRNVALTAPYMHNGRFQTLDEVVDFYASGGGAGNGMKLPNLDDKIRRFMLSEQERRDLVAFLFALTDEAKKPEFPATVPSGLPVVPRLQPNPAAAQKPTMAAFSASTPLAKENTRKPTTWTVAPGQTIQAALDRTIPGDTVEIKPGIYHETLLLNTDGVTIRGLMENGQRAVLDGQNKLTDALISSSHNLTIEGLAVKDYVSNGLTIHGSQNVTFRNLQVDNTGLYGVYPVECKGVLVEQCVVTKIKDAAIYVGQSADIIVRNNEAHHSVTGIEIENSVNSVVENNYCHDNAAGMLVFLLPNNPSKVAHDHKVRNNRIINNNHPNFGDPTAIVGKVNPGSGLIIMAADRTEVTGNEIRGNDSFGLAVVSLEIVYPKGRLFDVGVKPEGNRIYGNSFAENGRNPQGDIKKMGLQNTDIFWDGSGWDNSFEQPGVKAFPRLLPAQGWPDVVRRAYTRGYRYIVERML
jgi:parallel beta-helix repeat protein